jgi:hypothetical protein
MFEWSYDFFTGETLAECPARHVEVSGDLPRAVLGPIAWLGISRKGMGRKEERAKKP